MKSIKTFHRVARTLCLAVLTAMLGQPASGQIITPAEDDTILVSNRGGGVNRPQTAVIDAEGNFVVVWHADDPNAGNIDRVYLQRFQADGTPSGPREQVSGPGEQRNADVASDLAGNFVVVWLDDSENQRIRARVYRSDEPVGNPVTVANIPDDNQGLAVFPRIAGDLAGNFAIVWSERVDLIGVLDPDGDFPNCPGACVLSKHTVLGALFEPELGTLAVSELALSITTEPFFPPNIAHLVTQDVTKNLTTGEIFVSWWDDPDCTSVPDLIDPAPDSFDDRICGRRFDPELNALGDAFLVGDRDEEGRNPSIDSNLEGEVIVAWEDGDDIRAKRYDADGSIIAGEFQVNTTDAGTVRRPSVHARDTAGHFVIAWESDDGESDDLVRARWFADNFQEEGVSFVPDFLVEAAEYFPAVSGSFDGTFHVASAGEVPGDGSAIVARRFIPPVEIKVNNLSITEGDPNRSLAVFTVQSSKPHPNNAEVSVSYTTLDDTATFLDDYESTSGTLSFSGTTLASPVFVSILEETTSSKPTKPSSCSSSSLVMRWCSGGWARPLFSTTMRAACCRSAVPKWWSRAIRRMTIPARTMTSPPSCTSPSVSIHPRSWKRR